MKKATLKIEGMMCPMCEAHTNEAIRNAMPIKSVSSSHKTGETVIIAEDIDEAVLRNTVEKTGYTLVDIKFEPYEKVSFFKKLFKK